jgi:hypothetical protein
MGIWVRLPGNGIPGIPGEIVGITGRMTGVGITGIVIGALA